MGENRIGQGRDNAKIYLEANEEQYNDLLKRLRAHHGIEEEDDA